MSFVGRPVESRSYRHSGRSVQCVRCRRLENEREEASRELERRAEQMEILRQEGDVSCSRCIAFSN